MNTFLSPFAKIALLILMYILGGIILTYLDFYYLGLTYIIVYVGAIAIIFIFVIMMLDSTVYNSKQSYLFIIAILFFIHLTQFTPNNNILIPFTPDYFFFTFHLDDLYVLSRYLFSFLPLSIFIIGCIILSVLIGVLGLGRQEKE
jgi:NADH:ubiquinone oxidoreductase subunit 6 (subunit J)